MIYSWIYKVNENGKRVGPAHVVEGTSNNARCGERTPDDPKYNFESISLKSNTAEEMAPVCITCESYYKKMKDFH